MDTSLRNTPNLIARIERLRDNMIKHYEALVGHAGIDRADRNTTATTQYQMQVETAAIISAAEEFQVLIRQMQEMWLFGQLDTIGQSEIQQQTDENAVVVADLLKKLIDRQQSGHASEGVPPNGNAMDESMVTED